MKHLLIQRHAKAANESVSGHDFDRPLNEQGIAAATLLGKTFAEQPMRPDLVICSDAARTRQTWAVMAAEVGGSIPVSYRNELYLASAGDLLDAVNALPEEAECVMLIGHNPGLHHLARILSGDGAAETMSLLEQKLPTGGLAFVSFPTVAQWAEVAPNTGHLDDFWRPKHL
jgi:phosphohistidine phosphatase